jgi:Ca2+-binding RTX toxin-like protein
MTNYVGTTGDDTFTGGNDADDFDLSADAGGGTHGGNDTVFGGENSDVITMGGTLNAGDHIDGGGEDGSDDEDGGGYGDIVELSGDYTGANALVLSDTTLVNIEALTLSAGHSYDITTAATGTFGVDATALGAGDSLIFDSTASTNIGIRGIETSAGTNVLSLGGDNDYVVLVGPLTANDRIDGGGGSNILRLPGGTDNGNVLMFDANSSIQNFSEIDLYGSSWNLTTSAGYGPKKVFAYLGGGQNLTFDGSLGGAVYVSGSDSGDDVITTGSGRDTLIGRRGNDVLQAGGGKDTIDPGAGNDTVYGGAGDDSITFSIASFAGKFDALDHVDGGTGDDTVTLRQAYGTNFNVVLGPTNLVSVENLSEIGSGYAGSFNLTTDDATVAAGRSLTISSHAAYFTLNGSAETDGRFVVNAGGSVVDITTGSGNDRIALSNVTAYQDHHVVHAAEGADTVLLTGLARLSAADTIDGGAGDDKVVLAHDYTGANALVATASTLTGIEILKLSDGFNYKLTTADETVAAGAAMIVAAGDLTAGHRLTFDGSAETDGHFVIRSGFGADNLTGGALGDTFTYLAADRSTGKSYDTIHAFDFDSDVFNVHGGVSAIDAATTVTFSGGFNADMAAAVHGHLHAHHAIAVTSTGDGSVFLVVDQNGHAGYQSGEDLVIRLVDATGTLTTADFV